LIENGPEAWGWRTGLPGHYDRAGNLRADQPQVKVGLGAASHKAEVAFGSFTSFWLATTHFRSSANNRHSQRRSACLKDGSSCRTTCGEREVPVVDEQSNRSGRRLSAIVAADAADYCGSCKMMKTYVKLAAHRGVVKCLGLTHPDRWARISFFYAKFPDLFFIPRPHRQGGVVESLALKGAGPVVLINKSPLPSCRSDSRSMQPEDSVHGA
jgi:hypothetical protein